VRHTADGLQCTGTGARRPSPTRAILSPLSGAPS
jgi:hypothetical protein